MTNLPKPELSFDFEAKSWELTEDWTGEVDGVSFNIKEGYRFDLASIPRPLWWLVAPIELGGAAPPLVHDYLYGTHGKPGHGVDPLRPYSRLEADRLFLSAMIERGVSKFKRVAAFLAVRFFGWLPWPPPVSQVRDAALRAWNTTWQVGLALIVSREPWIVLTLASAITVVKGMLKPTFYALLRYSMFKSGEGKQHKDAGGLLD
jgi:hypothetical protein